MKSILIAISALDARRRFSDILSNAGYHVLAAESGESAIELAKSVNPDLVLMAIVMPTLDGLQTASRLRAVLSFPVPIVLLGTVTPIGIDEKPLASLVNDYLNLDVSSEQLLACVAKHLGTPSV
ncbi:MAG: response regulator [Pyrinomonadaceae bacterium]